MVVKLTFESKSTRMPEEPPSDNLLEPPPRLCQQDLVRVEKRRERLAS